MKYKLIWLISVNQSNVVLYHCTVSIVKIVLAQPKTVNIILDKVLIFHFMESNLNKV